MTINGVEVAWWMPLLLLMIGEMMLVLSIVMKPRDE